MVSPAPFKRSLLGTGAGLLVLLAFPAASARSAVVDSMDTLVGWTAETNGPQASNHAFLVEGQSGQALARPFDFSSGDYAQLAKNFSTFNMGEMHLPGARLRFYLRGSGPANQVLFRLTDSDGDTASLPLAGAANTPAWTAQTAVRSAFTTVPASGSDGFFDFFRVKKVEVSVVKTGAAGSGTLDVDKIEIVQDAAASAAQLLDDFNGGAGSPNQLGGAIGTFAGSTPSPAADILSATYDNSSGNVYEGAFSLKLSYDFSRTTETVLGYFNSPAGDLSAYSRIEFYAKSSGGAEAFELAFGSSSVQQAVKIGGIGKEWSKVSVDLLNYDSVFRAGAGAASATVLVFRLVDGLTSAAGSLWLDEIRFVRPETPGEAVKVFDALEEPTSPALTSWSAFNDVSASASLSSITGGADGGRALRLTYNLGSGNYAGLLRTMEINGILADGVRFFYKYAGSKANTLQVNLVDDAGTRFFTNVPGVNDTGGQWRRLALPLTRFQGESAGAFFRLSRLQTMRLTVLDTGGGTGSLAVDDLEVLTLPKTSNADPGKFIRLIEVDNNPFSPNGDGVRDAATFSYELAEQAFVRLRVYDMGGSVVREIKKSGPEPAGAGSLSWDGNDNEGGRVKNGLYFFQFEAESSVSDAAGRFAHVIAVLR
ncbi:MAG: FlgD immunoglobulin-like domain containing protein [Elusimicrobiota bacterium]